MMYQLIPTPSLAWRCFQQHLESDHYSPIPTLHEGHLPRLSVHILVFRLQELQFPLQSSHLKECKGLIRNSAEWFCLIIKLAFPVWTSDVSRYYILVGRIFRKLLRD